MATVTTQERTNILKLVAGMFNAAPGATYLNEFTDAFVALNKDLGALANALGQTGAFKSLYPSFLSAEEFANKFLDTLGLKANTEAQDWVKAKVTAGESYASVAFQALVAIDASTAAEFKAAKDQLANKAAVAEYYSVDQNKSATDLAALQAVVAKVTNDAATVEAAKTGAAATAGQTFTLTDKVGEAIVGTAGNDTVSAVMGDATGATGTSTLNLADTIDGGAGTDTFNLILAGAAAGALPTGVVIKNVEKINLIHTNDAITIGAAATAATTSSTYAGIAELWQTDNDSVAAGSFGDVSVAQGVAAGFASTGKSASAVAVTTAVAIDSTAAATSATVVVDGVATASDLNIGGAAVKTVTVKGSVALANDVTGTNGTLNIDVDGTIAETLNVGLTSKTTVTFTPTAGDTLKTLDMSSSTGNLTSTVSNTAETSLTSVKGSQGNDTMNLTFGNKALVVDLGAGADSITLTGTVGANVLPTVTLGAGKDTVVVDQLALVNLGAGIDTDANLTARMITVTDFNKAEDVINLAGTGVALTAPQLDTIKAATTLVSAATQAAALAGGVGGQVVFSWGSDAYVYTDVAAAGLSVGDSLVKIVGVDAAELSTGQNGNLVL